MSTIPPSKKTTMPALGPLLTSEAPEPGFSVCLVVLAGVNQGRVLPLSPGENLLGRDDYADVQFTDAGVSRRHALISCDMESATFTVNDLASSNGTTVNDVPVKDRYTLSPGDKITLGQDTVIRFSLEHEVETRYAAAMYRAVLRDGLTGAFNRRYFDDRIQKELSFTMRYNVPLALLFLDIDRFKRINDDYEHRCGDAVLRQVADILHHVVRNEDVLARYGGEEFAIICRETTEAQGAVLAERLRLAVQDHRFTFEHLSLRVTVSLGVAQLGGDVLSAEKLVSAADLALLSAKEQGRNRVVLASLGQGATASQGASR